MWIEQLEDGRFKYVERYIDPMTEKYKRVSTILKTDSNRAQNEARRILNARIEKKINDKDMEEVTFLYVLEKWWEIYKNNIKDTTALRNEWNLKIARRYIEDDFLIKNITTNFLQDMLDSIYYTEDYSFSTTRQVRSIISILFDYAEERNYIAFNPVTKTKIVRKPITFEEQERIENNFLEKNELSAILDIQRNLTKNKRYADLTEFLALTGLRFGEAIGLKYENLVDDKLVIDGTLDYQTQKTSAGSKQTTKTKKSRRTISLTNRLITLLLKQKEENLFATLNSNYYIEKDFFFTSTHGNPIAITNYNNSLKRAAKKAKINKGVSSHTMRHTHISILAEMGLPLKTIMNRVGHEKAETTLKIYTHVTKKMEQDLIEKLESFDI